MAKPTDGCVTPAKGPILEESAASPAAKQAATQEVRSMGVKVGKPAPNFEVPAFIDGGFKNISLSDYKGKWVVLCFYPGDFTFV